MCDNHHPWPRCCFFISTRPAGKRGREVFQRRKADHDGARPLFPPQSNLFVPAAAPRAVPAADIVLGMSAAFTGPSRGLGIELYRGSHGLFRTRQSMPAASTAGRSSSRRMTTAITPPRPSKTPSGSRTGPSLAPVRLRGHAHGHARSAPVEASTAIATSYLFFPFTGAEPQRQPPYDELVFNLRASYRAGDGRAGRSFPQGSAARKSRSSTRSTPTAGAAGTASAALWPPTACHGRRSHLPPRDHLSPRPCGRRWTSSAKRTRMPSSPLAPMPPVPAFIRDARDAGWDVPIANISFVDSENLLALLLSPARPTARTIPQT